MAHDFGIKNKTKNGEFAYFFGYLNGFLYKAFGDQKHDRVISGDNGTEIKTRAEVVRALDIAIDVFNASNYPDPDRMNELKEFRKRMEDDDENDVYIVWYS